MNRRRLFAIVLAAGSSSRFGSCKQLADYRGQPLVRYAVRAAESVCGSNSLLVVGKDWQAVHAACAPLSGFLVCNDNPRSGMAGSIVAGVAAVAETADAVLIMLADQPLVDTHCLQPLVDAWQQHEERIVCTTHAGIPGPPSIFPAACFPELQVLAGDRGARSLLERHADRVVRVPSAAASVDIDTPQDMAAAERHSKPDA